MGSCRDRTRSSFCDGSGITSLAEGQKGGNIQGIAIKLFGLASEKWRGILHLVGHLLG